MEFNGTFEMSDTTVDEVWLALSDPVLIADALPGCEYLYNVGDGEVDWDVLSERAKSDERELSGDPDVIAERAFEEGKRYAALMQISVGPVNPTFETVVTIEERQQPEMWAAGEGTSGDSSFEMSSWMGLSETEDGVEVDWETDADVFGKVAGVGQRVINPVANRVIKRFFSSVQSTLHDLTLVELEDDDDSQPTGTTTENQGLLARLRGFIDRLFGRGNTTDSK